MRKSAFTLLELIVVITIIGVLAAFALPRLFSAIERSRAAEAINMLNTWRASIERCALWNNGRYDGCIVGWPNTFDGLDIDDPFDAPNSHFSQAFIGTCGVGGVDGYLISAQRDNTVDPVSDPGGTIWDCVCFPALTDNNNSVIALCVDIAGNDIEVIGSGLYEGI